MKIGWVNGWAVPERWFAALAEAAFPTATHVFVAAAPPAMDQLEASGPFDLIVGYSLGSLLLLRKGVRQALSLSNGPALSLPAVSLSNPSNGLHLLWSEAGSQLGRVALLAPIFAFPREAGLGGRVARSELRHLARRLRNAPEEALDGFYARAGLAVPPGSAAEFSTETLVWGLEQLETVAVPATLPPGWRAWCGANDALLDAAQLQALAPGIAIVPQATHDPVALIRALALAP